MGSTRGLPLAQVGMGKLERHAPNVIPQIPEFYGRCVADIFYITDDNARFDEPVRIFNSFLVISPRRRHSPLMEQKQI